MDFDVVVAYMINMTVYILYIEVSHAKTPAEIWQYL